jgi:hypothetical protein
MESKETPLNFWQTTYLNIAAFIWVYGIVLAQGFWLTTLSCVFPPYAFYLVVEKIAKHFGLN